MARTKNAVKDTRKAFFDAIHQIVADKGFDRDEIMEVVEAGLIAAYRKKYKTTENIHVVFDKEKEDIYLIAKRQVVDNVVLAGMQISLDEAQNLNPEAKIGDEIDVVEHPMEYGRIAAQTAMQVVTQRLRGLEQNKIRQEYNDKVGELMNGFVLRKRGETVYVDLGRVEAIMPVKHQIPGERYRVEDKVKVLLHSIENENRGRGIKVLVSRADRRFVQKLFEMEVPEIYDHIVEIRNIGRIAGIRSKVVVSSSRNDVDPVGACVGVRGVRIQAIVRELGNERIDIVEYSEDPQEFITNALSPATPVLVKVDQAAKEALAVVPDKELSIAIGKDGSNVKIASNISGFRIDVKTESEFSQEMSSPEARRRLDELFSTPDVVQEDEEDDGTPLTELPGLTPRIQKLLTEGGITCIEDLVALEEEDLINLDGIGTNTARRILEIITENVEFEEAEAEDDEEENNEEAVDSENSESTEATDDEEGEVEETVEKAETTE